jgi:hypothetical protein
MLTVEKRWATGYSPDATDERNATEFLLDLCFRLSVWPPDEVHLKRHGDLLAIDFVHIRSAHELLRPWLDTTDKVTRIENGLRTLGLKLELRLKGSMLATVGQGNNARLMPGLLGASAAG